MPRSPNRVPPKSRRSTMERLTMQRRHFQLIAETIAGLDLQKADEGLSWREDIRLEIAQAFAQALRSTNPGFDTQRFLDACKATPEVKDEPEMNAHGCPHGPPLPRGARCSLCED